MATETRCEERNPKLTSGKDGVLFDHPKDPGEADGQPLGQPEGTDAAAARVASPSRPPIRTSRGGTKEGLRLLYCYVTSALDAGAAPVSRSWSPSLPPTELWLVCKPATYNQHHTRSQAQAARHGSPKRILHNDETNSLASSAVNTVCYLPRPAYQKPGTEGVPFSFLAAPQLLIGRTGSDSAKSLAEGGGNVCELGTMAFRLSLPLFAFHLFLFLF